MAEQQMVSMNVDPEIVQAIIRKNIETSLLSAMGDESEKGAILDAIVMSAIKCKVNSDGKISSYNSDNKYEYLDWKIQQVIRGATATALNEYVESKSNTFKKAIKKAVEENAGEIANNLVKAFAESAANSWRFKVNLEVDTKDD